MNKKWLRYSEKSLNSLGYNRLYNDIVAVRDTSANRANILRLVKGKFANIIDILYSDSDGSLDSDLSSFVSENSPDVVKAFVQNVLMVDRGQLLAAPDDETAFDMIIPREAQTAAEIQPYLDYIASQIHIQRQNVVPSASDSGGSSHVTNGSID